VKRQLAGVINESVESVKDAIKKIVNSKFKENLSVLATKDKVKKLRDKIDTIVAAKGIAAKTGQTTSSGSMRLNF
jgi:hypothetical protein